LAIRTCRDLNNAGPRIDNDDVDDGGIVVADDDDGDCYPPPAATPPSLSYLDWSAATVATAHCLAHPPRCNHNRNHHHDSPGGGRQGGGGACHAVLPCPSRGRCHVPILIGRHIATLVFQQGGQIRAASVIGLHPEKGDGREQRVPLRPGGGGIVPRAIRLCQGRGVTARHLTTTSAGRERERLSPIVFVEEAMSGA
jgi:hypothetical protein